MSGAHNVPRDLPLEQRLSAEYVAPEINAACCNDMDLEAFQDCDDPLVWEVHCVQCNTMAVYIHDRGPLAGELNDGDVCD